MWIPLFDKDPTDREREKFMNSYWVRQLRQYRRLWNEAGDAVLIERTGSYPIWHFEVGQRDGKTRLILTDTRPVDISGEKIGSTTARVDYTRPDVNFRDTVKSLAKSTHGFKRQFEIIKGEVDTDGRVNNPTHWANNPNIKDRRAK